MIGIIDYGMGNLYSVSKALERLEIDYFLSGDVTLLEKADGYILPGVGSFKDAMNSLNETNLTSFIKEQAASGKPLLGICLGMQLLYEESEENGLTKGLGLLKGKVTLLPRGDESLKVPHMGWNSLNYNQQHFLFEGKTEDYAYFVHSYYVNGEDRSELLASSTYGVEVPAVVGRENVFGTQFHPEKSSETGINILRNFAAIVEGNVNR
ncbi:imidazole glycerol phosphate synthase subunit HisH [Metabacillus arenae]|uniref:Imidazole glycerol phosphate synthase subunit HisH n=1 Tax=Metabacillus arenae TaxID=2771434 RepID=A0A926NHM9_9BACI|nr:imidazole glycerol phosphate synthase subunit HisH [Metabacillus arenae]MBD1381461.1 imidazole glycerol phosphate synthase subunit HisH [Metabacillus arenae]